MKGYAGKIGYVDLGTGKVEDRPVEEKFAKEWIGGNGFGINLLLENTPKGVNPLRPENAVIFASGPTVGTTLPCTGRFGVFAKSPQTGFLGESYCGGSFGAHLKFAGYDALVIRGKAKKPVYLKVSNGIEVKSAEHLWGKGTFESEEELLKEYGEGSVACIGQAGENGVLFACVHSDFGRQAGRTGMGTVMGSKNLKGLIAFGDTGIEVADYQKIYDYMVERNKEIPEDDDFKLDMKYGTNEWIRWMNEKPGCLPTKNFEMGVFDNLDELDPYDWSPKKLVRSKGCAACNKACGKVVKFEYEGKEIYVEGPEYETLFSVGSNVLNSSIDAQLRAHYLCDLYGMDGISAGDVVAWAMEASEKGIIKEKIEWGSEEDLLGLLKKIAMREGIGEVLSLGVKKASEKLGGVEFAVHVKGLENRGACHLRSCFYALDLTGKFKPLGIKGESNRFEIKGKAENLVRMEDLCTIYDSMIMCKFNRGIYTPDELANMLNWVTGFSYTGEQIMEIGGRTWTQERRFNVREGLTRADDTLPKKFMTPAPVGATKGKFISKEDLEEAKDEYYKARGWSGEGVPETE